MKYLDDILVLGVEEFDASSTEYRILERAGKRVLDVVTAFDIEARTVEGPSPFAYMYIWQFAIGHSTVIIGRTWTEFKILIDKLMKSCEQEKASFIVYVHNLSYEFQFLRGILEFDSDDVFCVKSRKILRAVYKKCIEFRCSYIQTNMSLSEFTTKMGVKHRKLDGEEYVYDKVRYQDSIMSDNELSYCVNDVVGLVEGIEKELDYFNDTLLTIPLTSTGYVRRDAKKALKDKKEQLRELFPQPELYRILRDAFRGGNTHANRYYSGRIMSNVKSYDRSSSYPDVQCNCDFPVTPFERCGPIKYEKLRQMVEIEGKAVVFKAVLYELELRDASWGFPYLSKDKCWIVGKAGFDNGRVLYADAVEITVTDVDYKIVIEEYIFSRIEIEDAWCSSYGKLPRELVDTTISYYKAKTSLKGKKDEEVYYVKAKNKLNSVYGMQAQDPAKPLCIYSPEREGCYYTEDVDIEQLLRKSIANGSQFMPYQWGVWVTAWARYRLEEGLRIAGPGAVYCDTDSVKYIGERSWEVYNDDRKRDSLHNGAYAVDTKGCTHYMGVYEDEGCYDKFITWGAKKYCYEKGGELGVTVSGVSKKYSVEELESRGGIKAFKPGLLFVRAGGLDVKYNDVVPQDIELDGHHIEMTTNAALSPSTYTLGITGEYAELIGFNPDFI